MIRVTKPSHPPDALRDGADHTRADCAAYDANAVAYSTGKIRFGFDRNVYGHEAVRTALRKAQHRKCCYCEGRFEAFAPFDVEHYRPKGAVRQDENSQRQFPGYYWLAYSWENLYLCCQACNRSGKKDLFPLADDSVRARSHRDDVARESPLLLDPGGMDDPRAHVRFRQERAVGLTEAGRRTIEVLDLNRPELCDARLGRLKRIRTLQDWIRLCADRTELAEIDLQDVRDQLDRARYPRRSSVAWLPTSCTDTSPSVPKPRSSRSTSTLPSPVNPAATAP